MKINIRIKPNSKKGPLIELVGETVVVYVREAAIDGKANEAVVKLLSAHYGAPKSCIKILRGVGSKYKTVEIDQ